MRKPLPSLLFLLLLCLLSFGLGSLIWTWLIAPRLGWISFIGPERTIVDAALPLRLRWTFNASNPIRNAPRVIGHTIILGTGGSLISVSSDTGQQLWRADTGSSKPFLLGWHNDVLFFPSQNYRQLTAADLMDGKPVWTLSPDILSKRQVRYVFVNGESAFVVAAPHPTILAAYSPIDGKFLWKSPDSLPSTGFQNAITVGEEIYLFIGNDLYIFNAKTGALEKKILDQFEEYPTAIVGEDVLLVYDGGLKSQSLETGQVHWQFDQQCSPYSKFTFQLMVVNNQGYGSGGCNELSAIDLQTGQALWRRRLSARPVSNAVVLGGIGYVILEDASILAFDLNSGASVGELHTTLPALNPFLDEKGLDTDGTNLYATFGDNKLFAFGK